MRTQIGASLVESINTQIAEIERVKAYLKNLKEKLEASGAALEKAMEQDSSHSEELLQLEVDLSR